MRSIKQEPDRKLVKGNPQMLSSAVAVRRLAIAALAACGIAGAVNWWLQDPPHRAALLSTAYHSVGVGVRPGSAFPQDTGGAQAITVVADFGACAT